MRERLEDAMEEIGDEPPQDSEQERATLEEWLGIKPGSAGFANHTLKPNIGPQYRHV
jgi:hypothetical protein